MIDDIITEPKEMTRDERQLDLWKRWQKSGDEGIRKELLTDLQPLIRHNLGLFSTSTLPYGVLRLKANTMLRDALSKYDPNRGASIGTFTTHSLMPMSRYVQKYQNVKYLPQYLVQEYGRFENEQRKLRDKLGREPRDEELGKALNLSERQIRRIKLGKSPEVAISTIEGMDTDKTFQKEDQTQSIRNRDKLFYLRTTLKGTERKVFDLLTGMGRYKPVSDRAEIARRVGVPVEQVYSMTRKWARQVK